jgi:hypothetical protein
MARINIDVSEEMLQSLRERADASGTLSVEEIASQMGCAELDAADDLEQMLAERIQDPSPLIELSHADIDRIIDRAIESRRPVR